MKICCQRVPLARDIDFEEFALRMEGFTGADIESLCKKATLLAIAEFQNATRVAPFVVLRSDFLQVLESDRGSPKLLKKINVSSNTVRELYPDASTR
jgi:transitional endoplasmic reticulum ATPase